MRSEPLAISVTPEVIREGEPVYVNFYINNPAGEASDIEYMLYADGTPVMRGTTKLGPETGTQFQYVYVNPLKLGEQVTFFAKTKTSEGTYEKSLSIPATPPQVWSSFVSFASFSTSVMGSSISISSSMSSMSYYDKAFSSNKALNAGLIFSIVLILLLIYLELSEPLLAEKKMRVIGNLRIRFSRLSGVLFIIFVGMVFTQIALIVGGAR